jgi:hypothetical protein
MELHFYGSHLCYQEDTGLYAFANQLFRAGHLSELSVFDTRVYDFGHRAALLIFGIYGYKEN